MPSNLFKKAAVFTDIHFGLRHNSKEHNEDCLGFLRWMIEIAKTKGAETCIFMGDFHHHRNSINAQTQGYMIDAMHLLSDSFDKTYFLVGNHDLYFRENRTVTSSKFATLFPNIQLIMDPIVIDDVALVPWLVEDEWKEVAELKTKYLFGHLELPGFKMNARIDMPDHGMLNATHFEFQDYVFSGHFHLRQTKGNVNYIGNPFGHNFSDVWDFDRGAMFLEWDGEPEYINYTGGPRFINISLSSLTANPELYLITKTHLQVVLDVDITYEEATALREIFLDQYDIREFKLIRNQDESTVIAETDITMKTVDTIVIEQLLSIVGGSFDSAKLIEIYDRL
jgi:DNA repair exonuclease SbcCD nuclease subunit